jgi:hypothetical protein
VRVVATIIASLVIGVPASIPAFGRSAAQEAQPVPPDSPVRAQAAS